MAAAGRGDRDHLRPHHRDHLPVVRENADPRHRLPRQAKSRQKALGSLRAVVRQSGDRQAFRKGQRRLQMLFRDLAAANQCETHSFHEKSRAFHFRFLRFQSTRIHSLRQVLPAIFQNTP